MGLKINIKLDERLRQLKDELKIRSVYIENEQKKQKNTFRLLKEFEMRKFEFEQTLIEMYEKMPKVEGHLFKIEILKCNRLAIKCLNKKLGIRKTLDEINKIGVDGYWKEFIEKTKIKKKFVMSCITDKGVRFENKKYRHRE